jgi:SAM-dependent methyltransferase
MAEPNRQLARQLARESLAKGDATGWFDALYNAASGDPSVVPWADMRPNPNLGAWLDAHPSAAATSPRALVVGCGLGDDAEEFASRGWRVTAFDIAPRAIDWCRQRFPSTVVQYCVADVLALPKSWSRAFDLVVEIYTLQVLPPELRIAAIGQLAECVAPGGGLLVIARARDTADGRGTMPWPLLREELDLFNQHGLEAAAFEDFLDTSEEPPVRRFRAVYRRAN